MADYKKSWGEFKMAHKICREAVDRYARLVADEAGLTGEARWVFLERTRQLDTAKDILSAIGVATLVVTPYVVVKAITK